MPAADLDLTSDLQAGVVPFFQAGQAVYYLELGRTRADLSTLTLGAVERITHAGASWQSQKSRARVTFRPVAGRPIAVGAHSLAHAGWCPLCELPAHARLLLDGTVLPVCPRCRLQALPVPPPERYILAHLGHRESSWIRFVAHLGHEGLTELSWDEFNRAYRAFERGDLLAA